MKLYYMPSACSLSVQITLHELELPHRLELVDSKTKTLPDGSDFHAVNPRGQVPVLELDDGSLLTEGPVIVQYLADMQPGNTLVAAPGTMARYREMEWLNYLTSELHQRFYSLFVYRQLPAESQQLFRADLDRRLVHIASKLGERPWLMGDTFTSADGYLFTMLRWTGFLGIALERWPELVAYRDRVAARPAVQAAMRDAGLLKA